MPDRIIVSEEEGVTEVFSSGEVSSEQVLRSLREVIRIRDATGIQKVLVDTRRQSSIPGVVDLFHIAAMELPLGMSFAILVHREQVTREDLHFLENVAVNRGGRVRVFTSRQAALCWLHREPVPPSPPPTFPLAGC